LSGEPHTWGLRAGREGASGGGLRIRELGGARELRAFVDAAWRIHSQEPLWIAPPRTTIAAALDPRKHPFHQHSDVSYFVAERDGATVGRIASIVNRRHNAFHQERTGFFGLFDCEDDPDAAAKLVETVAARLKAANMTRMRGPMSFSTNEEIQSPGVLVEGFERPPAIAMPYNPPRYAALLEGAGLRKCIDLLAYSLDDTQPHARLKRSAELLAKRRGAARLTIRSLNLRRLGQEIRIIKTIYDSAWRRNWGFVPMTEGEFAHSAQLLRPVIDPDLCLIAEAEGQPVGFSLAVPDLNQALQRIPDGRLFPFGFVKLLHYRRRIDAFRVLTLGLKPGYRHQGIDALLYLRTWEIGARKGYKHAEASWILEDNRDMRNALEKMGARVEKRYRVYELPL
jgi:GNAT superfamily N-acetyltransferase